jgi:hypothetical protein
MNEEGPDSCTRYPDQILSLIMELKRHAHANY